MQKSPGKLLSIYIDCSDRCGDHALFEVIVDRCRDMGIAGATVISGLEGFGETAQIRKKHVTHSEEPVVVLVADSPENIARVAAALQSIIPTGVMAVTDVELLRVEAGL